MPHPILIAAGMAIIVGAGYVIYTELNRNSEEEEAYHVYCATIRAEKEARNRRLNNSRLPEFQSAPHSSSALKKTHYIGLRHRSTNRSTHQQVDYPLIDLGQQVYPPLSPLQRSLSPAPSTSSTKSDLKRLYSFSPILDTPIPDAVIFIAPGIEESIETERSTSEQGRLSLNHALSSSGYQDGSRDITDERPLIDWKPQGESTTLGQLFGLQSTHSPTINPPSLRRLEQTEFFEHSQPVHAEQQGSPSPSEPSTSSCQHPAPSHQSAPSSSLSFHDFITPQLPVNATPTSQSEDWSAADEPLQPFTTSPSLDENWSDLGSESFEHI